jgi:ribosome biogenesis GTPase A
MKIDVKLRRFDLAQIKDDNVVLFIGKRNTGKSFLMNRILLDRGDGFTVGPTVNGKAAAAVAVLLTMIVMAHSV